MDDVLVSILAEYTQCHIIIDDTEKEHILAKQLVLYSKVNIPTEGMFMYRVHAELSTVDDPGSSISCIIDNVVGVGMQTTWSRNDNLSEW